jgi:hypothetical protein
MNIGEYKERKRKRQMTKGIQMRKEDENTVRKKKHRLRQKIIGRKGKTKKKDSNRKEEISI